MINPKELRIGNLVMYEGDVYTLVGVNKHNVLLSNARHKIPRMEDSCTPIPLTKDILLKCGFNQYELNIGALDLYICPKTDNKYSNEGKCLLFFNSMPIYTIPCESVHQLQNLYFAIVGKELEITIDG